MFCPTAVDQFFVTKLSKMDLNMNNNTTNSYKQRVGLEERIKDVEESRKRYYNSNVKSLKISGILALKEMKKYFFLITFNY